jgi:DNA-binding CsgD family transcriptional regulator
MGLHDDMHAAIASLHAAGLGDVSWEDALDKVLAVTGFVGAALWLIHSVTKFAAGRAIWHRLDTSGKTDYIEHYANIDPHVPLLLDPISNRIRYDYLALSEADMNRSEYYAWHGAASGGMRYRVGGATRPDLPFFGSLTLHRPKPRGHAAEPEIERFRLLFDHVERALEVEYRLNVQRGITAGLAAAAVADTGCVVLDHRGHPVFVNDEAIDLAKGAFTLGPDCIAVHGGEQDRALRSLIATCLDTARGTCMASGGAMRLSRPPKGDLVVTISPIPRHGVGPAWPGASVLILIVDPNHARAPDEAVLREICGLSPAEAALAGRLAIGETLREAAIARGIAFTTARSYLEQIFHRTGARRQADLVRLLLTLPKSPVRPRTPASRG